ncbi:hypothetical protein B5G13_20110 [Butyricimonas sp. An62]|nr:hypothetical protein B5G13_20110 [Butyricimonas sp. An62]
MRFCIRTFFVLFLGIIEVKYTIILYHPRIYLVYNIFVIQMKRIIPLFFIVYFEKGDFDNQLLRD